MFETIKGSTPEEQELVRNEVRKEEFEKKRVMFVEKGKQPDLGKLIDWAKKS